MKQAAGKVWAQAGDLFRIGESERRLRSIVDASQKASHLGSDCLDRGVRFYAHLFV